jgi:hypothetical protein
VIACEDVLNLLFFWPDWIRPVPLFEHHRLLLQVLALRYQMDVEASTVVLVLEMAEFAVATSNPVLILQIRSCHYKIYNFILFGQA